MKYHVLLLILVAAIGCNQAEKPNANVEGIPIEVKYAEGFKMFRTERGIVLEIHRPHPGASTPLKYLLTDSIEHSSSFTEIAIPVTRIVCTSTSHIPMLEYLDVHNTLVGFPTLDYISSERVRERVEDGKIVDIGNAQEINLEKLIELQPELVVNFSMDNMRMTNRMESLGLNVIVNGDYLENHPLGRAEWIKVFGALTGTSQQADSVFSSIEAAYQEVRRNSNPDVTCAFSGSLYGDTWFMPGSQNYAAQLLEDAGFDYVVENDSSYGFLQWGFENVFQLAKDCDFWLSPAPFPDLQALENADERYSNFKAFREGNVFVYDNKTGPTGGNEYLELGYLRPDIILKDLVKIRNPALLPDHKLYFYRKLE